MPSLYEPTGMVTEFNAQLTPVIAHATGGLRRLVTHYDFNSGSGSGFHFGVNGEYEPGFDPQWASIRGAGPEDRANVDLYNMLADALAQTLQGATEVFAEKPEHYARILSNLLQQVTKFSWGPSVYQYLELFDRACTN